MRSITQLGVKYESKDQTCTFLYLLIVISGKRTSYNIKLLSGRKIQKLYHGESGKEKSCNCGTGSRNT